MDDGIGRYAVEVPLVEDDQGDVVMITEAFEQSGMPVRLQVVAMASRPCSSSTVLAASPRPPGPA